jgi:quinol-cytochrome oxidoreductase complex cytochrome b subunit
LLHEHGSNNPNGVTSNGDRYAMHPYFIFKDLVTIFAFFLVLSVLVFFYPNLLGLQKRGWPNVILLIVNITYICAICWKNIINYNYIKLLYLIKIHNKTVIVSGLFIIIILRKYIIVNINPVIVKYYYEIFNQQITKILNNFSNFCINFVYFNYKGCCLLLVGISETLRTQKNNIIKFFSPDSVALRPIGVQSKGIKFIKSKNINHNNNLILDNHNKEINLKFKQ